MAAPPTPHGQAPAAVQQQQQQPPLPLVQDAPAERWMAHPNLMGVAMQLVAIGYQGGLAESYRRDAAREARSHRLAAGPRAVSVYQDKCKLCNKPVAMDLVNYDPERQGLKCCSEDCGKPIVYHQACIKHHMIQDRVACFNVACRHCSNHVKVSRELAFSPSGAPYLIWRLVAWAWAHLIFWPLVFYPIMYMFFWGAAMLSWYTDPKNSPYPGIPGRYTLEMTLTELNGTNEDLWIIDNLVDRWRASALFYWALSLSWMFASSALSALMPTRLKELANPYNWLFNYR